MPGAVRMWRTSSATFPLPIVAAAGKSPQGIPKTARASANPGSAVSSVSSAEPFFLRGAPTGMDSFLPFLAFLAIWVVLQVWVLPKLGVPT